MSIEERLKGMRRALEQWPHGARVWHRADGRRGIILEHIMELPGNVQMGVIFAHNGHAVRCHPEELSSTPVSDGTDGDEWKDGQDEEHRS